MRHAILMLTALAGAGALASEMSVGDGQIRGERIAPYEHTWRQCSRQDGVWTDLGDLTETVVVIGENTLRHRQQVARPDGVTTLATTYFERQSFAPARMELEAKGPDGVTLLSATRTLDHTGYKGAMRRGEEVQPLQGTLNSSMLHGGALGLPLATLDFQKEPLEFAASMMNFDASYRVIATWAGRETLRYDGREVEAWWIDLEWHHDALGDVYEPGPDGSGGRFWVVPNPPPGFPYVPRYQTDTYVVDFLLEACSDRS